MMVGLKTFFAAYRSRRRGKNNLVIVGNFPHKKADWGFFYLVDRVLWPFMNGCFSKICWYRFTNLKRKSKIWWSLKRISFVTVSLNASWKKSWIPLLATTRACMYSGRVSWRRERRKGGNLIEVRETITLSKSLNASRNLRAKSQRRAENPIVYSLMKQTKLITRRLMLRKRMRSSNLILLTFAKWKWHNKHYLFLRSKRRNRAFSKTHAHKRMILTLRYSLACNSMTHQRNRCPAAVRAPRYHQEILNLRKNRCNKLSSSSTYEKHAYQNSFRNSNRYQTGYQSKQMSIMIEES